MINIDEPEDSSSISLFIEIVSCPARFRKGWYTFEQTGANVRHKYQETHIECNHTNNQLVFIYEIFLTFFLEYFDTGLP